MSKKQDLADALQTLITQTEKALEEGTILKPAFREELERAKDALDPDRDRPDSGSYQGTSGGHILH